jgi:plastocyanin
MATLRSTELILTALTLTGCGLTGPAHGPSLPSAAATVDMGFESYSPATVTIERSQTVEWRNTSLITHTVTDDPNLAKRSEDSMLPAGAAAFNSGDISAGEVYTQTFNVPGTFRYFCTHHEGSGMVGTVVVRPAS